MTANVITYRPRLAVRDCGRALGFSEEQLSRISKLLPGFVVPDDKPLSAFLAEAGFPTPTSGPGVGQARHLAA